MHNLLGLGNSKKPFLYLDEFITPPNWDEIHTEASIGIARSQWVKRYVSSGVHPDWANEEITTYIKNYQEYLSADQQVLFQSLETTEERLKFMNCVLSVPHPFWLVYLRDNKRIERTGIENKSVAADSNWTENAKFFPKTIEFINSLPFENFGRVVIFMTEANNKTVPHYDAGSIVQRMNKPHDDFIWFTTTQGSKRIYVMDGETKEKIYPEDGKKFIWFNEMDFHGTDASPKFTFSIRIDGKFLPEVKTLISK